MGAEVAWFEITGPAPSRLVEFYRKLFGWTVTDSPEAGYSLGLQAYLDKAEQLGGKTVVPPTDLPGDFGRFVMFADPDGCTVGLWS